MKAPDGVTYDSRLKSTVVARKRWSMKAAQIVGASLIVLGIATFSGSADAGASHPLDRYPGFGRSPQAALRDDTIAYWESFRRERVVASCMSSAGFEYVADVAFPTDPMLAVGHGLAVEPSDSVGALRSPTVRNAEYEAALSLRERERFNQIRFGESAADIAESNSSGRVPDGRGEDFATGGCVGEAEAGIPSVWDLPRELDQALGTMRQNVAKTLELSATSVEYSTCAQKFGGFRAASPAEVEAMVDGGQAEASVVAVVLKECDAIWRTGYQKADFVWAQQFVEQNAVALADVERRYQGVMQSLLDDREFLQYLSDQMALSTKTNG